MIKGFHRYLVGWSAGLIWTVAFQVPAAAPATTSYRSTQFVNLKDIAAAHRLSYGSSGGRLVLGAGNTTLRFTPRSRQMTYNGTSIWLDDGLDSLRGQYVLTRDDYDKNVAPLLQPGAFISRTQGRLILLDPGHGGDDTGAIGRGGMREKNITLDLAKRVRAKLANAGFKVLLTRETDRTMELSERTYRASRFDADLFVSIHLNATSGSTVSGVETYALTPIGQSGTAAGASTTKVAAAGNGHEGANFLLAYAIQRAMRIGGVGEDRGVRRARYAVLKDAPCPAALVECAFISHGQTETLLQGEWFRDKIAQGIADGIQAYYRMMPTAGGTGSRATVTTQSASSSSKAKPAATKSTSRSSSTASRTSAASSGRSSPQRTTTRPEPEPEAPPPPPPPPPIKVPASADELLKPPPTLLDRQP